MIRRGTTGMVQRLKSCHIGGKSSKISEPSRSESLPVSPLLLSSDGTVKAPRQQEPQSSRAVTPAKPSCLIPSSSLTFGQASATGYQSGNHTQFEPEEQYGWKPINYERISAKRHKRDGEVTVANPISADSIQYLEVSPRTVPSPIPASPHDASSWGSGYMHTGNTDPQTIPELNVSNMVPENYSAFPVCHDTQPKDSVPQSLYTTSSGDLAPASVTWNNSTMWPSIKPPACSRALPNSDTSTPLHTHKRTPDLASMQKGSNHRASQVLCSSSAPSSPANKLNPVNSVSTPETMPAASTPRPCASLVDLSTTPLSLDSQLSQILKSTPLPADGSPQHISELPQNWSSDLLRKPSLYSIPAWSAPNYNDNGHESTGTEIRESLASGGDGTINNQITDARRLSRSSNIFNHTHRAIWAGRQKQMGHFPRDSRIPNLPVVQKHSIVGNHEGNPRKRTRTQYSPNLIVDIAETCQELFPFSVIAERHNVPPQKVFDTFSAIIQLPLLRRADDKRHHGSLGRQRVMGYRDAKKAMEKAQKTERKARIRAQRASAECLIERSSKTPARRPDLLKVATKNRTRNP